MYGMIAPFIFIFAPFLFMKYILKIPIPLDAFWNIMKKMLFGGTGFMTMLDKMFNGLTVKNIKITDVKNFKIPIPSLEKQNEIIKQLDFIYETNIISSLVKINNLKHMCQLMLDNFTKKITDKEI